MQKGHRLFKNLEGRERFAKAEVEDPAPGIVASLSPPTRLDDPQLGLKQKQCLNYRFHKINNFNR